MMGGEGRDRRLQSLGHSSPWASPAESRAKRALPVAIRCPVSYVAVWVFGTGHRICRVGQVSQTKFSCGIAFITRASDLFSSCQEHKISGRATLGPITLSPAPSFTDQRSNLLAEASCTLCTSPAPEEDANHHSRGWLHQTTVIIIGLISLPRTGMAAHLCAEEAR